MFLVSITEWNSRTFLAYRTELIISLRNPNFFNISMFFWVQFDRTELYFVVQWFSRIVVVTDQTVPYRTFFWKITCARTKHRALKIFKMFDSIKLMKHYIFLNKIKVFSVFDVCYVDANIKLIIKFILFPSLIDWYGEFSNF